MIKQLYIIHIIVVVHIYKCTTNLRSSWMTHTQLQSINKHYQDGQLKSMGLK